MSGSIIALREASILTIPRSADNGTVTTETEGMSTLIVATKSHKRVFTHGGGSHFNRCDWIYVVVA